MRLKTLARFALLAAAPGAILPNERRKPRAAKVTIKEKDLQSMAEDLCDAMGIRFFRIPDSLLAFLRVYAPEWTRVFVYRYLSGLPDIMLFRAIPEGKNEVRFIEIKTEAGKLHQSQAKWHSGLNVIVTYGWAETEAAIRGFGREAPAVGGNKSPVTLTIPHQPKDTK